MIAITGYKTVAMGYPAIVFA